MNSRKSARVCIKADLDYYRVLTIGDDLRQAKTLYVWVRVSGWVPSTLLPTRSVLPHRAVVFPSSPSVIAAKEEEQNLKYSYYYPVVTL